MAWPVAAKRSFPAGFPVFVPTTTKPALSYRARAWSFPAGTVHSIAAESSAASAWRSRTLPTP